METPSIIDHLTRREETVSFTLRALKTLDTSFLKLAMTFSEFEELSQKILEHEMSDRAHFESEEFTLRHRLAREMGDLLSELGNFKRDESRPGIEYRRSFIYYGKEMLFSGDLLELLDDESYQMNEAFECEIIRFYNEIELIQKRIAARMLTLGKMAEALAGTRLAGHRAANLAVRHCTGDRLFPDPFFGDETVYTRFLVCIKQKMALNREIFPINATFALFLCEHEERMQFPEFGPMGFEYGELSEEQRAFVASRKYLALDGVKPSQLSKQLVLAYFSRAFYEKTAFFTFGSAKEQVQEAARRIGCTCHIFEANCAFTVAEFAESVHAE